jgi:hypothetical protein
MIDLINVINTHAIRPTLFLLKWWAISAWKVVDFMIPYFYIITIDFIFMLLSFKYQSELLKCLKFCYVNTTTYYFFQCIKFYSLLYRSHKDLDVLLAFSLFFTSYIFWPALYTKQKTSVTFFIEVNQTLQNKNLRQPCNICKQVNEKNISYCFCISKE